MQPRFRVTGVSGQYIEGPNSVVLGIELVDEAGNSGESDSVTIHLDDAGILAIPPEGAQLGVSMGYVETGLTFMGSFVVEEATVQGWGRSMSIKATGTDFTAQSQLKAGRTQDHQGKTVEEIIGVLAGQGGLKHVVSPSLASFRYEYLGQTEESNINLLTRLGQRHDAVAKIANGTMLFIKKGEGLSGSGRVIGTAVARYPDNVKSYEATFQSRSGYGGTVGAWWDPSKAKRTEMKGLGALAQALAGGQVNFKIGAMHADGQKEAEAAAKARADKLARDTGQLSIVIIGDPSVVAGGYLEVVNVRPRVDGSWWIEKVTQSIDQNGFQTLINAKIGQGAGA